MNSTDIYMGRLRSNLSRLKYEAEAAYKAEVVYIYKAGTIYTKLRLYIIS